MPIGQPYNPANQLIGSNLCFNLTKATQDATCDMYVYGVILK